MAKASNAVAKATPKANLPANLNEAYAAEVAELQKRIAAPSGDRIKCNKDKTFSLPNGDTGEELEAIVVDFVAANLYYAKAYKEGDVVPPDCFALGLEPAGLVPSDKSPDKQCESCAACWANAFKSHPNGRGGKACGNTRLLAILPPDADVETPLMVLKVSASGLKSFDAHAASVARSLNAPVRAVVTRISFDPNVDYQSLRFAMVAPATKDQALLAQSRLDEARQRLLTEPNVEQAANDEAPPAKRATRALPGKKVAGKR